jgi:hypothetical protein
LIRFVGAGPVSAFAVFCMLAIGSSAQAQTQTQIQPSANRTLADPAQTQGLPFGKPVVSATRTSVAAPVYGPSLQTGATPSVASVPATRPASLAAIATAPLTTTTDLSMLVAANSIGEVLDEEGSCLATAVYFEARGETLDGQLAVAQVVMNRALSGRYPATWCAVVKQRAQFSFVRSGGRFPAIKPGCPQWSRAQAIARIATKRLASALSSDVLWYHANYVAPSWGRRLNRVSQIGAHIFYRA